MTRPMRIEYEDACYHVMNRGRARQKIFYNDNYFELFLGVLLEAHTRFGIQVLSYCLMDNHYHLLIKTPEANLGRAMRHINGVYTQRHNRLKKTDGSLFRGRYKAICVEADSYQLQLSRYIHLNPLEAKMIKRAEDYPWSSYRYYVNKLKAPDWLYQQEIYDQLHVKSRHRLQYKIFVESGVDDEIADIYNKGNITPFLGSDEFRNWAYSQRITDDLSISKQVINHLRPSINEIVARVATVFKVTEKSILQSKRGRIPNNVPRWVAMYISQELGSMKLGDIAREFGLKRTGSIPTTITKLRVLLESNFALGRKVNRIMREYDT